MTKEIQNSNFPKPNGALRHEVAVIRATTHWDLVIGHSLDIGIWTLDICGFAALLLRRIRLLHDRAVFVAHHEDGELRDRVEVVGVETRIVEAASEVGVAIFVEPR